VPVNQIQVKKPGTYLIILFFVLLLWGSFSVLIHNALSRSVPGIDFYVFWSAGRVYFSGQDPYSPAVDLQIQEAIYGQAAGPDQDPMAFDYPPFVLFLIAPLVWLDFGWAQAIWLAFNLLIFISAAYVLNPTGSRVVRLLFPFFYPAVFGLILGNFVIAITVFVLVFLHFMLEEKPVSMPMQVLLGILLAWSAAKPQFVWLFVLLILLYGLREKMWPFLAAFTGGLVGMLALSLVFLPVWPLLWLHKLGEYSEYFDFIVLDRYLSYLLPVHIIPYVSIPLLAVCAGFTIWLFYKWWHGQVENLVILSWVGFATFLVHISTVSYEQLAFLIPVFLWAVRQKPTMMLSAFWAAAWALSFFLFYLDVQKILPRASDDLPFLIFTAWLAWYIWGLRRGLGERLVSLA
jgi:hypothetical protein